MGSSTEETHFLYTITVTNVGDEQATGVELIDALPPGDALSISVSPFPMFDGEPVRHRQFHPTRRYRPGDGQLWPHHARARAIPLRSRSGSP